MKKSQAQAERHSNRAGALRGPRPWLNIYLQKHTANQMELHAPHHLPTQNDLAGPPVFTYLTHIFLFIHRLQAQAYSRGLRALRGSPAQRYFFLFIHRLQAQAHSNRQGPHSAHALYV